MVIIPKCYSKDETVEYYVDDHLKFQEECKELKYLRQLSVWFNPEQTTDDLWPGWSNFQRIHF